MSGFFFSLLPLVAVYGCASYHIQLFLYCRMHIDYKVMKVQQGKVPVKKMMTQQTTKRRKHYRRGSDQKWKLNMNMNLSSLPLQNQDLLCESPHLPRAAAMHFCYLKLLNV